MTCVTTVSFALVSISLPHHFTLSLSYSIYDSEILLGSYLLELEFRV